MEITVLVFLSSGLFLGWSLGANDAANVFGTAVGSRMIRFVTAALISSIFITLGAVISGAGAAHGLGKLGAVNALPGAFMTALAAALTVFWMTRMGLPVSTTQAIVGAIVGWNLYSGSITDMVTLSKIVGTWVAAPILGAIFSAILYKLLTKLILVSRIHLFRLDNYTRIALIIAGTFGAYSLGANNIGNVMGVFVSSSPFREFAVADLFTVSSVQQLFLVGGIAIAVGVFTYSKRVMMTIGDALMPLNPIAALSVVIAQSVVLFLFASTSLEHTLLSAGLPTIPLIPVSSSQAVVGAVLGIGLLYGVKGARQIRWRMVGNIAAGWAATPLIAAVICFIALFFLQNVFGQKVYHQVQFLLDEPVLRHLEQVGVDTQPLQGLKGQRIARATAFRERVRQQVELPPAQELLVVRAAETVPMKIAAEVLASLDRHYLSGEQIRALEGLIGKQYQHRWQLEDSLAATSSAWKMKPATRTNKVYNKKLGEKLNYVEHIFLIEVATR